MENKKTVYFEKILFYSVPTVLAAFIIFLQISGLPEIWRFLCIPAVLFLGGYLMEKGKAWGSIFGILLGISFAVSGILEVPSRVNMGNAGPRIEPDFEDYWWQLWHTDITWGFGVALFFVALGVFVYIKNRKEKQKNQPAQ